MTKKKPTKKTASKKTANKKSTNKLSKLSIKKLTLRKPKKPTYKQGLSLLVAGAVFLFILSGWVWWHSILLDPSRAMSDMLANSLQTRSVTKIVKPDDSGQNQVTQAVRLNYVPGPMSHSLTEIIQPGRDKDNVVVTETIGTQNADFVRYKKIDISGKNTGLENIVNVWASQASDEKTGAQPTFLNEASLAVVPFANLNSQDRDKILKIMREQNVYQYTGVKTTWHNFRPTLVYQASIKPSSLIEALKTYAEITGIGDPAQLNPSDYASANNLNLEISIDALSRQLTAVNYVGSGRAETYSGYGIKSFVVLPKQTISVQELQSRTQTLAQ